MSNLPASVTENLTKVADEALGRVEDGISAGDAAAAATASKKLSKCSGGKMWGSPSCWMHLMFVEFRWMILVYYTCYTLIINTVYEIDLQKHSGNEGSSDAAFVPLISCMGGSVFEAQLSLGVKARVWGSSEYVAYTPKCAASGPCSGHTSDVAGQGYVKGCMMSASMTDLSSTPATLNTIILMTIMPMYGLLVLYNLFFKLGAFKCGIANKEYIQALQQIQTARWYRTYTSIVLVVNLGLIVFGAIAAYSASENAFLNHIAGSIALLVLIPSPRRIAAVPDKIEYNGDAVKENRSSFWLAITTMFNWDTSKYYEEADRIGRLNTELKKLKEGDGEQAIQEIKNYFEIPFLCG